MNSTIHLLNYLLSAYDVSRFIKRFRNVGVELDR